MLFNSYEFLFFFLIVWVLYYAPGFRKHQVLLLIVASLVFYAWGAARLTFILLVAMALNSAISYLVDRSDSRKKAFILALTGVSINVLILASFKYAGLLTDTFVGFVQLPHSSLVDKIISVLLHMPLPIGISFYTFESISLVVDVYKGKTRSKTFLEHAAFTSLFLSFFPHLIAGPILRATEFYPQIKTKLFKDIQWDRAVHFLVVGYFLKMFVADNLSTASRWIDFPMFEGNSSFGIVVSLVAFSARIFADFAGYSFIAVGLGAMLGYDLPVNFKTPYISQSLREFWQRWHITLSTWIRDYMYIPLGGSRVVLWHVCLNLIVVMTLAGLWHGAAWGFALWGLFHGIGLCLEHLFRIPNTYGTWTVWSPLRIILTFTFVTLSWIFFKTSDFSQISYFLVTVFRSIKEPFELERFVYVLFFGTPVLLYHLMKCQPIANMLASITGKKYAPIFRGIAYGIMISLAILNAGPPYEFIYFQF
ncbi:MAG: hypothetical protein K2X93_11575 [Candidatus Obscuribacterales bacterium]|nr:hypothetical protein [Candidatus Obscuribacterales bacterium]